jgi:Domain of unknown function (DUF4911)
VKRQGGAAVSEPTTSIDAIYLQLRPVDIAFAKFLFESYEEIAIVRTLDRRVAIIVVLVVPDFLPVARAVIDALRTQIECVEIEAPAIETDDWLMRQIDGDD